MIERIGHYQPKGKYILEVVEMKYYAVKYYRTHYWIDTKYIKTEMGDPVTIARVKNITSVEEITIDEYKAGLAKRRADAAAKRDRFII